MEIKKNIQAVGMVLSAFGGTLNYTKLLKILYFINRQSLNEKGRAIIDDIYVNMTNGVVLSGTYNLIKNDYRKNPAIQTEWNKTFETVNHDLRLRGNVPEGELSKYEKRVIQQNIEKYENNSYSEMIELHHDPKICPEWQNPNGTSVPLSERAVLSHLGYTPEDIDFIENDKETFKEEIALMRA